MRKLSIILFLVSLSFLSFSQAPRIEWQRCLGGSGDDDNGIDVIDHFSNDPIIRTSDNGYLVGCYSFSSDGDVTGNHGATDIWLVRMDQYGNTLWKKNYGGTSYEIMGGLQETNDGGFILVGSSRSNDFDVIGYHGSSDPWPTSDIWVVRLDASGNILWQRCIGGTKDESAYQVKVTPDNGFIIIGVTGSTDGDVSGLHPPQSSSYPEDAWLIKLDSSGVIEWQRCIGGSDRDYGAAIIPTSDGGYLAGVNTYSVNGDAAGKKGTSMLLVKIGKNGDVLWTNSLINNEWKYFGNVKETADKGFIVVGSELISTAVFGEQGSDLISEDWFIAKIDSIGNILWRQSLNEADTKYVKSDEFLTDVEELTDGSFIACGYQYKRSIQNLTDIWVFKFSNGGAVQWRKSYGSSGPDYRPSLVKSPGDGYLLMAATKGHDGDVNGKHYPESGNSDIWIVKLGSTNLAKGLVYYDENLNGSKDIGEPYITGSLVTTKKTGDEYSSITVNGLFMNTVDTGTYSTTVHYSPYYTSVPALKTSVFSTYNNIDSFSFALQPLPSKRDLVVNVIPLNVARPGFDLVYKIVYKNVGTDTIANGQILFKKDSLIDFVFATPAQSSINADTIKWNYSNLKPFDTDSIIVRMRIQAPPAVILNDTISSLAIITPVAGDLTPADDTSFVKLVVQGSYDPNDKTENLAGKISTQQVSTVSYINYQIRFQNTGTDTAFNINVRDTLDDKLDWNSLQMVAASHPYQLGIKSQNQLTWSFNNILLADSNRNEPASHGFIAYRVKPKSNLVIGDVIKNTASIYFDYNLPVETNTQETEVVQNSSNPQVGIPTISSFSPGSAASGATVTITGTNFNGATAVSFGGTAATSFTVNSATSITAVIGTGTSGNVSVTTAGGTATLAGFTFIPAPTITSFTPTSGGAATSVTITGTKFTGSTSVSFGGIAATSFTVNSATSITAVVGAGTSGNVSVVTPGGTATLAGFTFSVVTAIDRVPANSLGIRFYPNPTTGSFVIDTLKLSDNWETLEIFDTQGKQKLSNFMIRNKTRVNVNVAYLSTGLYMAILKRKNGRPTIVKFLKL